MRVFTILIFLSLHCSLTAQFGVSARYNSNNFESWESFISDSFIFDAESDIHTSGLEFGVNYWWRLKEKRIEFLPEITYATFDKISVDINTSDIVEKADIQFRSIGFQLNTHFYFLDLNSDCDCPTFSKQSDFLSKGLYLFLSPGIYYNSNQIIYDSEDGNDISESTISYKVSAGLGYDIGLSDLLTITPFVNYTLGFNFSGNHFEAIDANGESSNLKQIQIGLRVSFRPDYQGNNF